VGEWPATGYTFVQSTALIDDHFIGLGLDLVTQDRLTESRLDAWLALLAPHLP
jgi:flavodoxin I